MIERLPKPSEILAKVPSMLCPFPGMMGRSEVENAAFFMCFVHFVNGDNWEPVSVKDFNRSSDEFLDHSKYSSLAKNPFWGCDPQPLIDAELLVRANGFIRMTESGVLKMGECLARIKEKNP